MCLLEQPGMSRCEPLGFVGFDIQLGAGIASETSGWVPEDVGGRILFHAGPDQVQGPGRFDASLVPVRTVPLLLWLTHRSLRALFLCTPSEAVVIGRRLAHVAAYAVGASVVEESSPAVLADLLSRWVEADPQTPTLSLPLPAEIRGRESPRMVFWSMPWSERQLWALPDTGEMHPSALWLPSLHADWEPAELRTYEQHPYTLVPVALILSGRNMSGKRVLQALDAEVRGPLSNGAYKWVVCASEPRLALVLAPLLPETWRAQMAGVRDRVAERLSGRAGCIPVIQNRLVALVKLFSSLQRHITGHDEIYQLPLPGARRTPPQRERALELRRRLMNAVALPFSAELMTPLPGLPGTGAMVH